MLRKSASCLCFCCQLRSQDSDPKADVVKAVTARHPKTANNNSDVVKAAQGQADRQASQTGQVDRRAEQTNRRTSQAKQT